MVLSHAGTDWLYFLLEIGRCHGIRLLAILGEVPNVSSGCTTGNNSQGCGCPQWSEIVPLSLQIYIGFSRRKAVSECVLLQLRYLQLYTTTYPLVRIIKPRKPCPPQSRISSDSKKFFWFLIWEQFAGGLASLAQRFCLFVFEVLQGEGKPRLWLTPCDQAPSAQDLSSHKSTPWE